ncbi:MAG: NUDIX domain-containing protein [Gammaproteobacteria bacterium]
MDKKHFTATVYIVSDAKVLLLEHKKMASWLPPGGHVEENELPSEAALREVMEETGLQVELITSKSFQEEKHYLEVNDPRTSLIPCPWRFLLEEISQNHYHIDFIYLAKIINNKIKNNEGHNLQWFSILDLEKNQNIFPNVKYYGIKAIQEFCSQ